ncbi:unnamed protein product [Musa hybrid cultivar]
MAFTRRGPCLEAPGPARPGPARPSCHESRTDGRDHRPHTTLHPPLRRDPFLLSHIVVLDSPSHVRQFWGFFTGFGGESQRGHRGFTDRSRLLRSLLLFQESMSEASLSLDFPRKDVPVFLEDGEGGSVIEHRNNCKAPG